MKGAKDKAKELVGKFLPHVYCYMGSGMLTNDYDENVAMQNAKQCALIAAEYSQSVLPPYNGLIYQEIEKVKQEITNL